MAQKNRSQNETLSGSPQPNFTGYSKAPIKAKRAPTTSDTGYDLGQIWVDKTNHQVYMLAGVSAGVASWTLSADADGFPISPYVVGPVGKAGYQTIQSALDAANSAGGNATVYVQPGTYTENLTLYNTVDIHGSIYSGVTITGVHTPPSSGSFTFQNCTLTSATHIFSSAVAGTATLSIEDCIITVTNGYVYNLANWTGTLLIDDCGSTGTNDGVVNNTAGALVKFTDCTLGAGTGNVFTYSGGDATLEGVTLGCPISVGAGGSLSAHLGTEFAGTLTMANNSTASIVGCYFNTGATAALTQSSSGAVTLSNCSIDSSNNPAIDGAGAGTLTIGTCTFLDNTSLAGTLTVDFAQTKTGDVESGGNLIINEAGKQLQTHGGAVTDFIGQATLVAGTVTIANTNIAAGDKIFISRHGINGSTALGVFDYSISAATSFTITALKTTDATTETNDVSIVDYFIVRQI